MQTRPFGKTGQEFPILSLGCQRLVDGHNCTEEEAIRIVHKAFDEGVRYFDTAASYTQGQSEERVGKALAARGLRSQVSIATKTTKRTRDEALRDLEASLKRLQTDHVEEYRLHSVRHMEDLEAIFAKDGALKAFIEAQEQGMIKYISISGHRNPKIQLEAIERFPFDSVLIPLSAADYFIYSYEHEFLPKALEKNIAIVGMKVLGMGFLAPWYEKALRYTLSLPVSTAIVGMESMEQLEKNLEVAKNFTPMTDPEKLEFYKEIIHLVDYKNLYWKSNDNNNPLHWNIR